MASKDKSDTQKTDGDATHCFLTSVAPEIRNRIYELVFELDTNTDLLEAKPPAKDLLLTCRQICEEAKGMHRLQYRRFWTETAFTLTFHMEWNWDSGRSYPFQRRRNKAIIEAQCELFRALEEEDVARISNVTLRTKRGPAWKLTKGVWASCSLGGSAPWEDRRDLIVPATMRPALESAGQEFTVDASGLGLLNVKEWSEERIVEAMKVAGKTGLSKEEVVYLARELRYVVY